MSERWSLHHGDCLAWLRTLPDESVDAVVTDPPAGIAFMGKAWDGHRGGRAEWVAWLASVMRECLRVLKPGGHALVWSLHRTEHWTACAVEDAGFEIRDGVYHLCAQGWPKSLDVSKAIDAAAGATREVTGRKVYADGHTQRSTVGIGYRTADPARDTRELTAPATADAKRWQGWGSALKPAHEKWILARKKLSLEGETRKAVECVTRLIASTAENEPKSSEAVGCRAQDSALKSAGPHPATLVASSEATDTSPSESVIDLSLSTASSWLACLEELSLLASMCTTETASRLTTDLRILNSYLSRLTPNCTHDLKTKHCSCECNARGAALMFGVVRAECDAIRTRFAAESAGARMELCSLQREPLPVEAETVFRGASSERWILARKPLGGTIAENVLAHGVGALNVDGCRVESGTSPSVERRERAARSGNGNRGSSYASGIGSTTTLERFTEQRAGEALGRWPSNLVLSHAETCGEECDAACPVAELDRTTADLRNTGVISPTHGGNVRNVYSSSERKREIPLEIANRGDSGGASRFFPTFHPFGYFSKAKTATQRGGRGNAHPTVKNVELMRWLVRLVTPPRGLVLDAFGGSGTTGVAALLEGFRFTAAEQDADSYATACARLEAAERGALVVASTASDDAPSSEPSDAAPFVDPRQLALFGGGR